MYCDKKMDSKGEKPDDEDIDVRLTERKINVLVHNSF